MWLRKIMNHEGNALLVFLQMSDPIHFLQTLSMNVHAENLVILGMARINPKEPATLQTCLHDC
jgi:hypothetical protein